MKEIVILPLAQEYYEYKEIIKDIDPDEKITIEMYPKMALDNQKKAMEKLTPESSVEDIEKALHKTKYTQVSKRLMELHSRGFGGGIISLFERFDNEEVEDYANSEILNDINMTSFIPKEIRKNAQLSYDRTGYYYAGFFKKFD